MSRLYRSFATISNPSKPQPHLPPVANNLTPPPTAPPPPPNPTPLTLNAAIQTLLQERNLPKLIQNFKQLSESSRFRTKTHFYEQTVSRLASCRKPHLINQLLQHQKQYQDITKEGFTVRLILLYGKVGMFEDAYKLFDEMPQLNCPRSVLAFNALLSACVHCKRFGQVVELFGRVPASLSITPDARSYNIVIQALCKMGALEKAKLMLDEMERNGVKLTLVTFNTLVNGFYGDGKFEEGERIWVKMADSGVSPNIISYNAKLGGLVRKGEISEAVKLVEELTSRELEPTIVTYNILIKWYCSTEELDKAKQLYDILLKNDLIPNRSTFEALIPCIYEKGDIDLALMLCTECVASNCFIDVGILQVIVEGLVKRSRDVEAEELVTLARSKGYGRSTLKMPYKVNE